MWVKNRDSLSASPTSLAAASIAFQLNISLFVSQPLFKEQQRIFCIERCTRNCNSLQGEFSSFTSQLLTGRHPYPFSKKYNKSNYFNLCHTTTNLLSIQMLRYRLQLYSALIMQFMVFLVAMIEDHRLPHFLVEPSESNKVSRRGKVLISGFEQQHFTIKLQLLRLPMNKLKLMNGNGSIRHSLHEGSSFRGHVTRSFRVLLGSNWSGLMIIM